MSTRRRVAAVVTATLLTMGTAAGCGALDKALDCVQTADSIANSVDSLQTAVANAGNDPQQADQALDNIESELSSLKDKTDDADLSKAVDDLDKSVDNVRKAIADGDNTPDLTPVTDAAGEIGKVCTPG